ncbi:MAG: hypothetical protein IJ760_00990 [Bacteroidales bacterium]|nr:hypothetical protein [Bacteroidales bacterium]
MKHIVLTLALLLASSVAAFSQKATFTTDGSVYSSVSTKPTAQKADTITPYTYDLHGTQYPIYIGRTGSCYILRTSKKSSKQYRQYLGEDISRDICTKLGRSYAPKSRNKNSSK